MSDPITLPPFIFSEFQMEPVNTRATESMLGRATETADYGTPYWRLKEATTVKLTPDEIRAAELFFIKASKGGATFYCHDYYRPRPALYRGAPLSGTKAAGGAFNGSAVLQSVTNSRTIVVSGLPAGFMLKARDNVEIRKAANAKSRSLHVIMADATASAGGVVTLSIEYPLNAEFTAANSIVQFEKPSCVMMLDQGFSLPRAWSGRTASFSATEAFFS